MGGCGFWGCWRAGDALPGFQRAEPWKLRIRGVPPAGEDGSLHMGDPTGVGPAAANIASTASGMRAREEGVAAGDAICPEPWIMDKGDRLAVGVGDGDDSGAFEAVRWNSG